MNIIPCRRLAVLGLVLVVSGCGGGGPKLYKAGGTVTNNKVPVEGVQVTFAYDDGNFANGYTDAAGKFQLNYMNRPGGAALGKCTVTLSKKGGAATGAAAPGILDRPPKSAEEEKAKRAAQQQQMQNFVKKQAELDAAGGTSGDFTKTGLVLEIKADEAGNNFAIDTNDFKK